jgi:hypothetical protein
MYAYVYVHMYHNCYNLTDYEEGMVLKGMYAYVHVHMYHNCYNLTAYQEGMVVKVCMHVCLLFMYES